MAKKIKKKKCKVDKTLFDYMFMTMETKHTIEDKVCLQSGNVLTSSWIQDCYPCLALQGKIRTPHIWAIVEIIASTLAPIVSSCVLNQCHGY
jgi:uncharacterized Fe-S cluster-containing MiaB family protein